jgi:pyrroline-5-carboxylate reductase
LKKLFSDKGLLLCGAGKMGGALLSAWQRNGLDLGKISVIEPNPSKWLISLIDQGLKLNGKIFQEPEVCVIAVKPQMVKSLLSQSGFIKTANTLFVSIAAGITIQKLNQLLGDGLAIVRAMPNTPASINKGVSCLIQNNITSKEQMTLVENLFSVVGKTIWLNDEKDMDAVTAISGSGPAYVFYLIEVMANAGIDLGLNSKLAHRLAVLTVSGSGSLAEESKISVDQLRKNVTSPNGTTEAALDILMEPKKGLSQIIQKAVFAAAARSKNLGS